MQTLSRWGGGRVPAPVGWTVSNSGKIARHVLFNRYSGDAPTWSLQWTVFGPAKNPTLYSSQTGRLVRLVMDVPSNFQIHVSMGYQQHPGGTDVVFRQQYGRRFTPRTEFQITDQTGTISYFNRIDPISSPIAILPYKVPIAQRDTAISELVYFSDLSDAEQSMSDSALNTALATQQSLVEWHNEYLAW